MLKIEILPPTQSPIQFSPPISFPLPYPLLLSPPIPFHIPFTYLIQSQKPTKKNKEKKRKKEKNITPIVTVMFSVKSRKIKKKFLKSQAIFSLDISFTELIEQDMLVFVLLIFTNQSFNLSRIKKKEGENKKKDFPNK